ncbi:putative secreted lipase [Colletotrichum spaethianum]|uniref:Carboxylic ester hydrolase n=1 Tax=Colletotrichum spaethianum TaxID=700344 RepID=A0AA37PC18_9PEZI|nr:putative secreted lipase [Colletotrichum spaethianum]GKT49405.1 putative secreted lipase [Colletotrichum spaethianum]
MSPPVSSPTRDQRPTVRLNQGTYIGTTRVEPEFPRAVEAFLGVTYAKCERLRRAVLPGASGDTFDASDYGPVCPTADPSFPSDEQCLNANIFRPATAGETKGVQDAAAQRKLPVLVYFHGGAFNFGRGGDRNLAAFVAFAKRDLVAVSFNYRLGPLGFLPCGLAADEGVANTGLLDQRALLQWVQRNIAAFGGDDKDVTVMGFSAGAHSRAPSFRRLIPATKRSLPSHPPAQVLPALRALPLRTLLQASVATWTECAPTVQWPFQPSIDGDANEDSVIPGPPIKTWASPSLPSPPPLMTGFNTSEGTMFVPATASSPTALADFFSALIPALTPQDLELLESLYPPASTYPPPPTPAHGSQFRRLAQAYGHYGYIAPLFHSAHFASLKGAPVWVYEYAAHADLAAANHGDHVPAATHDTDVLSAHGTPGLLAVSDAMHGYWSSFAATADGPNALPNASGIAWPRFVTPFGDDSAGDSVPDPADPDETRGKILVFGEGNDEFMGRKGERRRGTVARVRTLTGLEVRQFRFWWDRVGLSEGTGVADGGTKP